VSAWYLTHGCHLLQLPTQSVRPRSSQPPRCCSPIPLPLCTGLQHTMAALRAVTSMHRVLCRGSTRRLAFAAGQRSMHTPPPPIAKVPGSVFVWGSNKEHQLGEPNTDDKVLDPMPLSYDLPSIREVRGESQLPRFKQAPAWRHLFALPSLPGPPGHAHTTPCSPPHAHQVPFLTWYASFCRLHVVPVTPWLSRKMAKCTHGAALSTVRWACSATTKL